MSTTSHLARARSRFRDAQTRVVADKKTAKFARQIARAAKVKLKEARKFFKLVKKGAKKAGDTVAKSFAARERAHAKLEELQPHLQKERRRRGQGSSVRTQRGSSRQNVRPRYDG